MGAETLERLQKILRSKGGGHQAGRAGPEKPAVLSRFLFFSPKRSKKIGRAEPAVCFGVGVCLVCVVCWGAGGWLVSWVFGAVYFLKSVWR